MAPLRWLSEYQAQPTTLLEIGLQLVHCILRGRSGTTPCGRIIRLPCKFYPTGHRTWILIVAGGLSSKLPDLPQVLKLVAGKQKP